jgi:hypothetical protein
MNQHFARWTVLARSGTTSNGTSTWLCRCDCGTERIIPSSALRGGKSKSCGCIGREKTSERSFKHGYNQSSPTYNSWKGARQRCFDERTKDYPRYGGRGITFDPRWNDFRAFLRDMGECPPGYTLDRIDNDGPYSPENCRWSTPTEQQRKRAATKLTKVLAEMIRADDRPQALIAAEYGVSQPIISHIKTGKIWR